MRRMLSLVTLAAVLLCGGCGGVAGSMATNAGITHAGDLADAAGRRIGSLLAEKLTKGLRPSPALPRQAPERYEPAEFSRLASGAFNAEYAKKNIRVEAQFATLTNTY